MPVNPAPNPVKAYASVSGVGVLQTTGPNILSVTKTATGVYSVAFVSAMKSANYLVILSASYGGGLINYLSKTTAGFTVNSFYEFSGGFIPGDMPFSFLVIE